MQWSIPNQVIDQARELIKRDRILEVVPDEDSWQWDAMVMSDCVHHVLLDGTSKEKDWCDCPSFQEKGYCIHTVACELFLKEKYGSRLLKKEQGVQKMFSRLDMLLSSLSYEKVTPIRLYPALFCESGSYKISLKMSQENNNRKYIIKNLSEWLYLLKRGGYYQLGKETIFLYWTALGKEDQALLHLLWPLLELASDQEKRELMLSATSFLSIAHLLSEQKRLVLNNEKGQLQRQSFFPITLYCHEEDEGLLIVKEENANLIDHSFLLMNHFSYWVLDEKEQQCLKLVKLLFLDHSRLYLTKREEEIWWQHYYPQFKQNITIVLDEKLEKKMINAPLHCSFEVDLMQSRLQITPMTHYKTEQGVLGKSLNQYVIRDIEKENDILSYFKQQHYTQKKNHFVKTASVENIFSFFNKDYEKLKQWGEVTISQTLQDKQPRPVDLEIQAREKNKYLEINFDISKITPEEILPFIESIQKNDHFFETINGEWLDLTSDSVKEMKKMIQANDKQLTKEGTLKLTNTALLSLPKQIHSSEKLKEIKRYLGREQRYPLKSFGHLSVPLRAYQKEGVRFLKMLFDFGLSGILADDMGLGKTIQVLAYLSLQKDEGYNKTLIVVPASVIYNWEKEIQTKLPGLKVTIVHGKKEERLKKIVQKSEVWITSYASFRQDVQEYKKQFYHHLILDEAQMVKNDNSQIFKALKQIQPEQWIALSGTPIENRKEELWSLFHLILPHLLGSKTQFGQMDVTEIKRLTMPFILRRTKEEVLQELPKRQDDHFYSSLTKDQKALYLAYLKEMNQKIKDLDDDALRKQRIPILAGITRLRQICCSPALIDKHYSVTSGKLTQLMEKVKEALNEGHRLLIFSQFTSMLTILEQQLKEEQISSLMLTGKTKAIERQRLCEAFNQGQGDVFLISLKAGGSGLNLTGADIVILFDSWWNPAIEEQAAGRAHRLGQDKKVKVWHFIAKGTVEEKIEVLQHKKKVLFDQLINEQEINKQVQLTDEDLRYLLSYNEKGE